MPRVKRAGLILAAGESRRMGRPKALLLFHGQTFLSHLARTFSRSCSTVIIVLGHDAEKLRAAVPHQALCVVNTEFKNGQCSSLQAGLRHVPEDAEGVLLGLVDHPDPDPLTIVRLFSSDLISIPVSEGRKGHPVYFQRRLIPEFLALPPDGDARTVFRAHVEETNLVRVDDPGIHDDIDDPEALKRFRKRTRR